MRGRRGFTLIETMVCIAILAITLMAIPLSPLNTPHGLLREADYRYALHNAQGHLAKLREAPFDQLPPQVVTVPSDGVVWLSHAHLEPGSVHLYDGRGHELKARADALTGRITLARTWKGKRLTVDYRYQVDDEAETHTVSPQRTVSLWNVPVRQVEAVRVAHGDAWESLPLTGLSPVRPGGRVETRETGLSPVRPGGRVETRETGLSPVRPGGRVETRETGLAVSHLTGQVTGLPAGAVVEIDYLGEQVRNTVGGVFLTDTLQPSRVPTGVKLVTVTEAYGDDPHGVELSALRMGAAP